MPNDKEVDVMGLLLSEEVEDNIREVEQLNCLIYSDAGNTIERESKVSQEELVWKTENGGLTVQVWEKKGKIRIKVLSRDKTNLQIKRLAEIALNAIMEDLKKDTP